MHSFGFCVMPTIDSGFVKEKEYSTKTFVFDECLKLQFEDMGIKYVNIVTCDKIVLSRQGL